MLEMTLLASWVVGTHAQRAPRPVATCKTQPEAVVRTRELVLGLLAPQVQHHTRAWMS